MESFNVVSLILIAVAVAFAVLRVMGFKSDVFKDFAHIYVGGLMGAWLDGWGQIHLILWVGLVIVEIICFLRSRG